MHTSTSYLTRLQAHRGAALAAALSMASASVLSGAASASATTPAAPPTATSGSVAMAAVTPNTSVNVGGGTWNYGSSYSFPVGKHCWSNYFHPTQFHSATSIIGSTNNTSFGAPDQWADSSANGSITQTCQAYWDVF